MTITEPITLDQAKKFLRVEHSLEDDLILSLISVARSIVEFYQGRLIAERDTEEEYTPPSPAEIQAMYLLIAHYYENRNAATPNELKELPYGVKALLYFNREPIV